MTNKLKIVEKAGFTLVEILVSLILISLLVAAVFPVVTQQAGQADAPRLASDLVNVRSGIEMFAANLRNRLPKGIDELAHVADLGTPPATDIGGRAYSANHTSRWNGPYVDASVPPAGAPIVSGFDATIQNDLVRFNSVTNAVSATGDFVAIAITGLEATDFDTLNDLVDGETEVAPTDTGKLRDVAGVAYYLAVPYR